MRRILGGAILLFLAAMAWRISGMLSSDAIGMAVGMTLGVLAGVPTAALVLLARRRDEEDYGDRVDYSHRTIDQYPQPAHTPVVFVDSPVVPWKTPAPVFHEDVTPYYRGARSLMGMEPLPKRADVEPTRLTAQQISELEDYILFQKSGGVHQVDPRKFIVRWSGEE